MTGCRRPGWFQELPLRCSWPPGRCSSTRSRLNTRHEHQRLLDLLLAGNQIGNGVAIQQGADALLDLFLELANDIFRAARVRICRPGRFSDKQLVAQDRLHNFQHGDSSRWPSKGIATTRSANASDDPFALQNRQDLIEVWTAYI